MAAILEVKGITKKFGGLTAVNNVSFGVEEQQILSVIGPNGAGKSTLFKLISSFLRPTSGEVLFKSERISNMAPHIAARQGVVRTFQETTIFRNMSVRDNFIIAHHLRSKASLLGYFLGTAVARRDEQEFGRSADEILDFKLSRVIFEGPEDELQQTRNTQPAIAITSLALLRVAFDLNPGLQDRPAYVAGHSLGEYSALVAAGALGFDDAIRLLRTRGQLMQQAGESHPGTMAAILGLDLADCDEVCRESGAEICNINAPGQVVIGGRRDAVARALDYAKARGAAKVIPLSVSGAFHSSLMRPAGDGMVQPIATANFADAMVPVIGNCTARPITEANELRGDLVDHICRPVQWSNTVEWLGDKGITTYIEFGPGRVLTAIIKRMQRKATCINVSDAESVSIDL